MARFDYLDESPIEELLNTYIDIDGDIKFMKMKVEQGNVKSYEKTEYIDVDIPSYTLKMEYIKNLFLKMPKEKILSTERDYIERLHDIFERLEHFNVNKNDMDLIKYRAQKYGEYVSFLREIIKERGIEDVAPFNSDDYKDFPTSEDKAQFSDIDSSPFGGK